jgi:hypothetical protein
VPTVIRIPGGSEHGRWRGAEKKKEEDERVPFRGLPAAGTHRGGRNLDVKLVAVVCWEGGDAGGTQGWAFAPFSQAAGRRRQEGGTGPRAAVALAAPRRPVLLAPGGSAA